MALEPPLLGRQAGWLGAPPGVVLADIDPSSNNPFIRYRKFLWSYHEASQQGLTDEAFSQLVQRLDAAVAEVAGTGFEVTPFQPAPSLATEVGLKQLFVKDEGNNVGGSHKARHLFGLALHLEVQQVPATQPLAIASCGNAALAAALVAQAAQRSLAVCVPVSADEAVLGELDRLGAEIHICERRADESGDPALRRFQEAVAAGALAFSVQGTENIMALDGGRCLGWELAESLAGAGGSAGSSSDGSAANQTGWATESLFVQVGGGALASSIVQGLTEACQLGLAQSLPRIFAVQTTGCAPLARALQLAAEQLDELGSLGAVLQDAQANPTKYMWPWEQLPQSVATGILDDETYDWLPVVWAMLVSQGGAPVVEEATLLQASELATQHCGAPVGPTGAAGLAGVLSEAEPAALSSAAVVLTGRT